MDESNNTTSIQLVTNCDWFLIIDDEVYHIGASIKDLGKKWFGFTLMRDISTTEIINHINGAH